MSTNASMSVVLVNDPMRPEAIAVAGFLAGYCASARRSYATDLRLFSMWCHERNLTPFSVRRAHLELYGRWLRRPGGCAPPSPGDCRPWPASTSTASRSSSSIATPPSTSVGPRSTTSHGPSAWTATSSGPSSSRRVGLPRDHALASLLALNGLRISEALGADIADLDFERGHRTLKIVRKGGKHVTIPLAPRTSRAIDLYIGERTTGPIFLGAKGGRMDRYAADRTVKRLARQAGILKRISPHCLRHSFITCALDAGVALRDVHEAASHADPRTTMRYDRGRGSLDRHATYIVATFLAGALR